MKSFQQIQSDFVNHIRDPQSATLSADIEDRRLKIYRELFFNNILGFLNSGFPVLASIYGEQKWQQLARQFFIKHACRSPYFVDISKEFVEYLSNEHQKSDDDPAFFKELAHYEWLELDISIRKTQQSAVAWDGHSSVERVSLSQASTLAGYQYPVHQLSKSNQAVEVSAAVYIVVYRKVDFEVGFTVVNAVTAHMLQLFQQNESLFVDDIEQKMVDALPQIPAKQVKTGVIETIEQLLKQQILLIPED
ncbi:DNA-binding domain-containing protein [Aliiglaciecola litoralis]|uniref:DUF2063 domain-containing protein n=1 Tax=Aliiglaciecola litoralis TaxID=582857 RepID=A0ABN1LTF8_9ALTE